MQTSLDDILSGRNTPPVEPPKAEEPKEAPVEVKPEATEEAKAQRERDEQGRFKAAEAKAKEDAAKVEKKAEPTSAEKQKETKQDDSELLDPKAKAYYAKAKDEQRKRQELERRLAELEARTRQPAPKIDPLQDPEGFANRIAQEAENRAWDRILNFSEASARRVYGEEAVTEARDAFLEEMQANPGLYFQLQQQADPYEFVVKRHKREKFMREVTDPDEWAKQQREAIRKELEAEYAQKAPQVRPAPPTPPPSLASANSAGGGITTATTWNGPTPLDQIFKRK